MSHTPLAQKLGIQPSTELRLVGGPEDLEEALAPLPAGVDLVRGFGDGGRVDMQLIFAADRSVLRNRLGDALQSLPSDGTVWLAWPTSSSGMSTDLTREQVREMGSMAGLVDVKACTIGDVWAALKFVVRVDDRPTWPHRTNFTA